MKIKKILVSGFSISLCSAALLACSTKQSADSYKDEIMQWREERLSVLKGPRGYLNLVGLFRLAEGVSTFGDSESDDLRLTETKMQNLGTIGQFEREGARVTFRAENEAAVTHNSEAIASIEMEHGNDKEATVLESASLSWFVIERGGDLYVRARDYEAPVLDTFPDFEYFPIDPDMRFTAIFEPFESPGSYSITNVLGQTEEVKSTGTLRVMIDGETYVLDAADEGEDLFVVFGDQTNGTETYASGRFVYAKKPVSGNVTILDFNKSYTPPCAFSSYTTCPLPTKNNILPIALRVGEKGYPKGH